MCGIYLFAKGIVKELGVYAPGQGYCLCELPSGEEAFRIASMMSPQFDLCMYEVIPYEKSKEITRANLKAAIEAMKK